MQPVEGCAAQPRARLLRSNRPTEADAARLSGRNRPGTGQEPARKQPAAGHEEPGRNRAGTGRWAGTGQEPARNWPGTGQEPATGTGQEPARNRAGTGRWAVAAAGAGQQPHGRTTPLQNLNENARICRHVNTYIFLHALCSAEKRLTTRTCKCRSRAPETSPDHHTRLAPLREQGLWKTTRLAPRRQQQSLGGAHLMLS